MLFNIKINQSKHYATFSIFSTSTTSRLWLALIQYFIFIFLFDYTLSQFPLAELGFFQTWVEIIFFRIIVHSRHWSILRYRHRSSKHIIVCKRTTILLIMHTNRRLNPFIIGANMLHSTSCSFVHLWLSAGWYILVNLLFNLFL